MEIEVKRWRVVLATLLIGAGIVGAVIGVQWVSENPWGNGPIASITSKPDTTTEDRVTEWIYAHSTKASKKMSASISKWASKSDLYLLVVALVSIESEFNTTAESSAGAIGLGQIMWKVWGDDLKKAGIAQDKRDLFDEETNIKATIYVLEYCLKQSNGDVTGALTRYLGTNNAYYKNRITEACTNLYIKVGGNKKEKHETPNMGSTKKTN